MTLLFFIYGLSEGGAERVLSIISDALIKKGHKVIIAYHVGGDSTYNFNTQIKQIRLPFVYSSTTNILQKIYLIFDRIKKKRRIIKIVNPDVVISFGTDINTETIIAHFGFSSPIICCEHTNITRKISSFTRILRFATYKFASCITVLTRRDLMIARRRKWPVVYMPNPVIQIKRNEIIREKVVLAAGRVHEWYIKGFDNLLMVWGEVCHLHPDWWLYIAGKYDDNALKYLQNIIEDRNCKNVKFLGYRDDLNSIMEKSMIFCLSSRYEGFPMVLIEAMECGCACISFDVITGPREIIRDGQSGILVNNQDLDEMTNKLNNLMADQDLRSLLAKNAPQSIRKYSLNRIMGRWDILLNKLVKTE